MIKTKQTGERRELPAAFTEEMNELFQKMPGVSLEELPAFFESLRGERSYGLRRNPLKYSKEEFEKTVPFSLRKVSWAEEGYFYEPEEQAGKSPYHEAGAYYIQEPSAMIAVELLKVQPGDFAADLCAAPGGKSTQIAGRLQGRGLLVCNEYVSGRAEILAQNMERMGVSNYVILQEDTKKIAERFPLFFDKVLVDAPCSGEGMFRKEEQALLQWSPENVKMCTDRQREILENAAGIVKPGGVLVYSTCTFSEAEDEEVIRSFLERHPEFSPDENILSEAYLSAGICPGGLPGTLRMWPHRIEGEGHFAARLIKDGEKKFETAQKKKRAGNAKKQKKTENDKLFQEFCRQYLQPEYTEKPVWEGNFVWKKEKLFLVPAPLPDLSGLRAEKTGLFLGEAKKGRFEPSHTWAMTLKKEDVKQQHETEEPDAFLRGETLMERSASGQKGWTLILWDGRPLGWGKVSGETIKNHYPKGLRK